MTVYKTSITFCSSSKRNQRHTQNIQDAFPRNTFKRDYHFIGQDGASSRKGRIAGYF